jgi:hypothetical protein
MRKNLQIVNTMSLQFTISQQILYEEYEDKMFLSFNYKDGQKTTDSAIELL